MAKYGILKSSTNTGQDSELKTVFAAPLRVISNQPAFVSDSVSLKRVAVSQNVQRWEIETNMEITNTSGASISHAVLMGYTSTFYARMPQVYRPDAMRTQGTTFTTSGGGVGISTLNISGVTGDVAEGEFLKFNSHDKVYIVTDPGTNGTAVGIFPPLVHTVSNGEVVHMGDTVNMKCRYDTGTVLGMSYSDGVLLDPGSIRLIEAL